MAKSHGLHCERHIVDRDKATEPLRHTVNRQKAHRGALRKRSMPASRGHSPLGTPAMIAMRNSPKNSAFAPGAFRPIAPVSEINTSPSGARTKAPRIGPNSVHPADDRRQNNVDRARNIENLRRKKVVRIKRLKHAGDFGHRGGEKQCRHAGAIDIDAERACRFGIFAHGEPAVADTRAPQDRASTKAAAASSSAR